MNAILRNKFTFLVVLLLVFANSQNAFSKSTKQERYLSEFSTIVVSTKCKVYYKQGPEQKVFVQSKNKEIIPYIKTNVENYVLVISSKKDIKKKDKIKIFITTPNLKELSVTSAAKFKTLNKLKTEKLDITVSGKSHIKLKGKVGKLKLMVSGVCYLNGQKFHVSKSITNIKGVGRIKLNIVEFIKMDVSGIAVVKLTGNPQIKQEQTGIILFR